MRSIYMNHLVLRDCQLLEADKEYEITWMAVNYIHSVKKDNYTFGEEEFIQNCKERWNYLINNVIASKSYEDNYNKLKIII